MAKKFTLFLKANVFANWGALRKSAVLLARKIIINARAEFTFPARGLAANRGRFPKSAVFGRAVNYLIGGMGWTPHLQPKNHERNRLDKRRKVLSLP